MIDTIDSFMYRLLAFYTFVFKFIYLHYLSSLTHLLAPTQLQGIRKHLSQTMFLFLFCFLLLTLNICSKLVFVYVCVWVFSVCCYGFFWYFFLVFLLLLPFYGVLFLWYSQMA